MSYNGEDFNIKSDWKNESELLVTEDKFYFKKSYVSFHFVADILFNSLVKAEITKLKKLYTGVYT